MKMTPERIEQIRAKAKQAVETAKLEYNKEFNAGYQEYDNGYELTGLEPVAFSEGWHAANQEHGEDNA